MVTYSGQGAGITACFDQPTLPGAAGAHRLALPNLDGWGVGWGAGSTDWFVSQLEPRRAVLLIICRPLASQDVNQSACRVNQIMGG